MVVNILLAMEKVKQTLKRLFLITFIFLLGCATTTNTGLTLLPESKEIEIGKSYVPVAIEKFDGIYPERDVQSYITQLGNKLARVAYRNLPLQILPCQFRTDKRLCPSRRTGVHNQGTTFKA
jgi:hypothetical protein